MSLTMILIPAALALALWGGAMAVSGFRQGSRLKIFSAVGAFALLAAASSLYVTYIYDTIVYKPLIWVSAVDKVFAVVLVILIQGLLP